MLHLAHHVKVIQTGQNMRKATHQECQHVTITLQLLPCGTSSVFLASLIWRHHLGSYFLFITSSFRAFFFSPSLRTFSNLSVGFAHSFPLDSWTRKMLHATDGQRKSFIYMQVYSARVFKNNIFHFFSHGKIISMFGTFGPSKSETSRIFYLLFLITVLNGIIEKLIWDVIWCCGVLDFHCRGKRLTSMCCNTQVKKT